MSTPTLPQLSLAERQRLHAARTGHLATIPATRPVTGGLTVDTLPVLRIGVDRLPRACTACGSTLLAAEPPLGRDRFGTITCLMCGSALAHLAASPRPIPKPAPPPAVVAEPAPAVSPVPTPRPVPLALRPTPDGWELDGCDPRCRYPYHHPLAHEEAGRRAATAELYAAPALPSGCVATGRLVVDFDARAARVDGADVKASVTEFAILAHLARSIGCVVPHADMIAAVWGIHELTWAPSRHDYREMHTLRINLSRLRGRLGEAGALIVNTQGVGYCLLKEEPCPH